MSYKIHTEYIQDWLQTLDEHTLLGIYASLAQLEEKGPNLKKPLVGKINSVICPNMKELRPPSSGRTEIRMLFVFDEIRQAVFLLGGDKSSSKNKWNRWYNKAIPQAEKIYKKHLESIHENT